MHDRSGKKVGKEAKEREARASEGKRTEENESGRELSVRERRDEKVGLKWKKDMKKERYR